MYIAFTKFLVDGRLFVTSVREKGVPANVMTITNEIGEGGPLYPKNLLTIRSKYNTIWI